MNIDRTQWLEERRTYIGGSDIGIICGYSKYKTPLKIYLEKIDKGPVVEKEVSRKAYWGNVLEPVIIDEYAKRTGNAIEIYKEPIRHPKYQYLAANIDAFVNNREFILEIKTTGIKNKDKWGVQGTSEVPKLFYFQAAWYSAICDVSKVVFIVLIGGQEDREYIYIKDKAFEEKLIKIGCNFWNRHIVPQIPPPPVNNRDILLLHPISKDIPIVANDNMKEIVSELKELKLQGKTTDKKIESLSFEVQKYMENHNVLLDDMGNALITWNNTKKGNRTFLIK